MTYRIQISKATRAMEVMLKYARTYYTVSVVESEGNSLDTVPIPWLICTNDGKGLRDLPIFQEQTDI